MKKILLFIFCGALLLSGSARITADYVFSLVIDENIKDLSGNHRVPECHFGEDDFVSGEFDSVRFRKANHAVKVPFAAFPGKSGKMVMKFNPESFAGEQMLFRVYSAKGDGLSVLLRNGKLRGSYYNRAGKKYFHIQGPELQTNQWYELTFTWSEGKKITMQCNEWQGGRSLTEGLKMNFVPDSLIIVGNGHTGKSAITGKLHRFTLSDNKKDSVKAVQPAAKKAVRDYKLGEFTIGIDSNGGISRLAARGTEFVSPESDALWSMKVISKKDNTFRTVKPSGTPEITAGKNTLTLKWKQAIAVISADAEKDTLIWNLKASAPENCAIDSIEYPRLRLRPTSNPPEAMRFVYPSYFGCSIPDPFAVKDGKPRSYGNTYGGGAHYQFCFMHAPDKPGLYIETRDSDGRIKEFRFLADKGGKSGLFYLNQMPELRMNSTKFASAYEVRTSVLDGDWYDAAKRYRKWAIRQPWCRNGKLHENKVVPQWLKDCDFAVRIHTWVRRNNPRKVSTNVERAQYLADLLGKPHTLCIWYCLTYLTDFDSASVAAGQMTCGNARKDAVYVPESDTAMPVFRRNNQHVIHYINSRIFDQSMKKDHPGNKEIMPMVMRDYDGSMQFYGKLYFEGCRVDPRWQQHLLMLIKDAVKRFGFRGTYLDSFGRGQEFCYAADHGHKVAEDNGSVKGQRAMADRIKSEMRKFDPEYILCSEASIEQFIDYIDVKLHHYNVFEHSVPIWAAVYHDYQLVHGRTMNSEADNTPESNAVMACGAFHNGAIVGRFFADRGNFAELYCLDTLGGFYRQISACRQKFRDFLSYGEMLRPPVLTDISVPAVRIGVRKRKFDHPAVVASLWQASDGKRTMFVTNSSGKKAECSFRSKDINPEKIIRFSDDGSCKVEKINGSKLILEPFSVVALQ